ncbi:MAG: DUF308 domain-containing protein [Bacilli bacterium]|nr:DUF308 domain-containing protein [Bacilli bacterium]
MREYKYLKWNSGINAFIFLSLGFLLLLFPVESLSIAGYLIASILMLSALFQFYKVYKNKGIQTNGDIIYLIVSIAFIALSISIFVDPTWIIRMINILVGLLLIISSATNIMELLKYKKDRTTTWWIYLSFAIIILIIGIAVILNPLFLAKILTQLEGISLIIDTLVTLLLTRRIKKVLMIKENN